MEGHPPVLKNSPLQLAAIELRFPEAVFLPEDLKAIRRALAEVYPVPGTEHGIGIELTPEGTVRQQQTTQRQVYRTIDSSHLVALTGATLGLEARGPQYEGFRHLLDRWLVALEAVVPVAEITTQLRLGLRYVNQLRVEDAEVGLDAVAGRINPVLLSPSSAEGFEFRIATSFQELRLLQGEDGKATLRHGLQVAPAGDAGLAGAYILDLDYYDDRVLSFDRDQHVEQLRAFNHGIWELFRWSLTSDEYESMEPEDRE
jgi:uncharacterized protein (TIGR04255 family)